MRVLIVNPPYQTFTCNLGVGHQVPLGLLMVAGPLVDAGHEVEVLDAESRHLRTRDIVARVGEFAPDVVMAGHSGSTPAHPTCMRTLRAIREAHPSVQTIYGGIHPTFHAAEILESEPSVDTIVRGEGEETPLKLLAALRAGNPLGDIPGVAYRDGAEVVQTGEPAPIADLDRHRVAWELVDDWDRYKTLNFGRSAVVQFARGCPHLCTYCGQRGFWREWRHRSPSVAVDDIELLYREHDVRFVHLADDGPTTDREAWRAFLEALASRELPVYLHATVRADDIVRDEELLPLYREAGILYVLLGLESVDRAVLDDVRKASDPETDKAACRLLREHRIFAVAGQVLGLGDDTWSSMRRTLRRLVEYEPDWVNMMYAVPHAWTEFAGGLAPGEIVETDLSRWDYRHPILRSRHLKPWQLVLAAKWLELRFHTRPRKLWGMIAERDRFYRRLKLCTFRHTTPVWWAELHELARDWVTRRGTAAR